MPLRTKTFIAKLKDEKIGLLCFGLLDYVRQRSGFDSEHKKLFQFCLKELEDAHSTIKDAVMEILKHFNWIFAIRQSSCNG